MGESTRFRGHMSFRIFSYSDILNLFLEYCSVTGVGAPNNYP